MSGQLGDLVVSLSADIARFQSDMGKASKQAQETAVSMTEAFEGVQGVIEKIGTGIAGVAAGAAFKELVSSAENWNLEAMKMANTMGTSTEQASVLAVALHGLGISNDTAESAALKLSRTLSTGTQKFDQFGITVKDAHGNLLPMPQIMANVNQKLLETKSGADRNVMAMTLYGRSWKELQQILRLTPQEMKEAQDTAERLHLIVGPEGVEKSLAYKKAMNELHLTMESFAIQVGSALMPELVKLASWFTEHGEAMMDGFIHGLHSAEAEVTRLAGLMDTLGGAKTQLDMIGAGLGSAMNITRKDHPILATLFGSKEEFDEAAKKNMDYEKLFQDKEKMLQKMAYLEVGLDENGNMIKPKTSAAPTGSQIDPATLGKSKAKDDWTAAHREYLQYEKAFAEEKAAIVKAASDMELEINKNNYELGLTDLKTYLDTKKRLVEQELSAEVTAKKKDLADRTSEVKGFKPDKSKNDSQNALAYHEALLKQEQAAKAVTEAESKLALARVKNDDEAVKAITDQLRGYQEIQAQLAEMNGDYEEAASIRKKLDESSVQNQQLIANAMKGSEEAMDAYWAKEEMEQKKIADAALKGATQEAAFTIGQISNQKSLIDIAEKYYDLTTGEAALQRIELLKQELTAQKSIYDAIKGSDPEANALRQESQDKITGINNQLLEQNKIYSNTTAAGGFKSSLQDYVKNATDLGKQTSSLGSTMFKGMEDALTNFVMTGKINFKSLADSIIADMIRIVVQQEITGPLASLMSGGSGGSGNIFSGLMGLFGGSSVGTGGTLAATIPGITAACADGGSVSGSVTAPYLVGEQGPELFMPSSNGTIIPNGSFSTSGGVVNNVNVPVSISGDGNKAPDAATAAQLGDLIKVSVIGILNDQKRAGGLLA
jgi:hypothetical protein